ncbi:MAG: hypothetical protein OEU54_04330 [Gemmatimonadota bacterium]|nr:hypothetical protein [Gemmatimonadota bacterium]
MTISALPDSSRIWVFGATEPLTEAQRTALDANLTGFVRTWAAHGSQLLAAHAIVDGSFLVVAVDESQQGASGCSIDVMVRHLAELERALDFVVLDGARIWYRTGAGDIVSCERSEFQTRSEQGEIDAATRVFDPTIQTLGALRTGAFERRAGDSWHARLLSSSGATAEA